MASDIPGKPKPGVLEANKLKSHDSGPGVVEDVVRVVDHKAERALCRKFDYRLLPILAFMCEYLLCQVKMSYTNSYRPLQRPRQRKPRKCRNRWPQ